MDGFRVDQEFWVSLKLIHGNATRRSDTARFFLDQQKWQTEKADLNGRLWAEAVGQRLTDLLVDRRLKGPVNMCSI